MNRTGNPRLDVLAHVVENIFIGAVWVSLLPLHVVNLAFRMVGR